MAMTSYDGPGPEVRAEQLHFARRELEAAETAVPQDESEVAFYRSLVSDLEADVNDLAAAPPVLSHLPKKEGLTFDDLTPTEREELTRSLTEGTLSLEELDEVWDMLQNTNRQHPQP